MPGKKPKRDPQNPETYVEEEPLRASPTGVGRQYLQSGTRVQVLSGSNAFIACAAFLVSLPKFFW